MHDATGSAGSRSDVEEGGGAGAAGGGTKEKGSKEWVREALEHETALRWAEASRAWASAAGAAQRESKSDAVARALGEKRSAAENRSRAVEAMEASKARGAARRARQANLKAGQVLQHRRWGRVLAECVYAGEGDFQYAGKSYPSISAAARAACLALGLYADGRNGWVFWGVEKAGY